MGEKRFWIVVAAFALLAVACTDSMPPPTLATATTSTPPTVSTPPTTSSTSEPSTTTSTTSTTATTAPPGEGTRHLQDEFPELDMTVSDPDDMREFERILREYLVVEAWVNGHPFEDESELVSLLDSELYCDEFDDRLPKRMIEANRIRIDGRERVVVPPATVLSPAFGALHDPGGGFSYVVFETKTVGQVSIFDLDTGELLDQFESDPPSSIGRIIGFSPRTETVWCVRVEDA